MVETKKVVAGIALAVLCLGAGAYVGATQFPTTVEKQVFVENKTIEYVDVPFIVEKNVTVEVPVEKIVEVDNGDLAFVCTRLEDKAVIEDAVTCVNELKGEDEALKLAIAEIKDQLANELEDSDIASDEDDIEVDKIYSDYDQVEFSDSDYENNEYTLKIEAKVTDDDTDEEYKVLVTVDVEDGQAEIKNVVKVI